MDYKEQIEQLRKQIDQLEQQINKPKIEVGKWYKKIGEKRLTHLWYCVSIDGTRNYNKCWSFGFQGGDGEFSPCMFRGLTTETKLADEKEVVEALTKYCDELFKDCDRVDRSGLDLDRGYPVITELMDDSSIGLEGSIFMYKGVYVMDKHGRFAKGLKAEVKEEKLFTKQEVTVILEDYRKFTWNNGATKSDLELWIKENIK